MVACQTDRVSAFPLVKCHSRDAYWVKGGYPLWTDLSTSPRLLLQLARLSQIVLANASLDHFDLHLSTAAATVAEPHVLRHITTFESAPSSLICFRHSQFLFWVFVYASGNNLVFIALERHLAVLYPIKYKNLPKSFTWIGIGVVHFYTQCMRWPCFFFVQWVSQF